MYIWKRYACTILTALLLCLTLFSCNPATPQQSETDTGADTEPQTEALTTAPLTTEAVTTEAPITETQAPETTEAVTEPLYPPVIEDDGTASLSDLIPPTEEGTFSDPLTGLVCDEAEAERRPVAIMINNISAALPQQQIAGADVLYECEVEGGLTRLLGIYNEYEALTAIGSVRSVREYFIDFAANHNAILVHAGGSDEAYRNLKERNIANIDGVNGGAVTGYFYRDPNRLATMRAEHTLVIDGKRLNEAIAYRGFRTTYASSFSSPLRFAGPEQTLSLANGEKALSFTTVFGSHRTSFAYDETLGAYLRFQNGQKHIDGVTGEQLAFENVIVLICPYQYTGDEKKHITVSDVGSGDGYYMTGGKYVPIRWSKSYGDKAITLSYPSGREVVLNPGKTNFEIIAGSYRLTVDA